MIKHFLFIVFVLMALFSPDLSYGQDSKAKTLSAKKFERKMQRSNVVVLDVRTEEEFNDGHIENSVLLDVKKDDFAKQLQGLDKQKTYLVYCRSGKRSERALQILADSGFQKAFHLKGGYLNWQKHKE